MKQITWMLALSLSTIAAPQAHSAPAELPTTPVASAAAVSEVALKLKNVPPSWMARMLSPAPMMASGAQAAERRPGSVLSVTREGGKEIIIRKGTPEGDKFEADAKARLTPNPASVFALPEGVESITPDDASGELRVRGTGAGIEQVRQIVTFLDLPLRRVELEVLSVRLNKADVKRFQMDMTAPQGPIALGLVRPGNYKKSLQELLDTNRAVTLLEVRATVINNMSSFLRSGAFVGLPAIAPMSQVQLTPTINGDDTITVLIESDTQTPRGPAPTSDTRIRTVANVRDGDTIVFASPNTDEDMGQATITFLTPRLVRRVGEAK